MTSLFGLKQWLAIGLGLGIGFSYGLLAFAWDLIPANLVWKSAQHLGMNLPSVTHSPEKARKFTVDVARLVNLKAIENIQSNLHNYIFQDMDNSDLDRRLVSSGTHEIDIPFNKALAAMIDWYKFENSPNNLSIAVIYPKKITSPKLLIYQEGHFGGGAHEAATGVKVGIPDCREDACLHKNISNVIDRFLSDGYTIAIFWLPWHGVNASDKLASSRFGKFNISSWTNYRLLKDDDAKFFQTLVHPIFAVVNRLNIDNVMMVGLSYGANVVPLYAALDLRVRRSYSIDGNPPHSIQRFHRYRYPNFENYAGIRNILNSYELYFLAGHGKGRKYVQLLNKKQALSYIEPYRLNLSKLAQSNGSCFVGAYDETNDGPEVSDFIINYILEEKAHC